MFKNELTDEYGRIKRSIVGDKVQNFYAGISKAYIPLFVKDISVVDIQVIEKVAKYLFLIKVEEITYEEIRNQLGNEDYSSYVVDETILIIKLILFHEKYPNGWVIGQIRVKTLIFFLYLCYYYTCFAFNLIRLDKYEYIAFYEKFFAFNFFENQYIFIQFFSCMSEMNKKVI